MNTRQKKKLGFLINRKKKTEKKEESLQLSKSDEKEIVYGRAFRWDTFSEELTVLLESENQFENPEYGIVEKDELSISPLRNVQGYVCSLFSYNHIPFYVISSETGTKKLSLKLAQLDLYNSISVGDVLTLPICSMTDCTIFLKYEQILTIAVNHIEISNAHIMDVRDLYHYGDTVEVKIISKDDNIHFVNASIKALCSDGLQNYQPGDILTGRVSDNFYKQDKGEVGYFIEISPIVSGIVDKASIPFPLCNNDKVIVRVQRVKEQGLSLKFLRRIEA